MLANPAGGTPAGSPADLAEQVRACTFCHGDEGRAGPDGYYPRIAGKPAPYLYAQLLHFRDGRRPYDLMRRLLKPLSDDDLRAIAEHFARQTPPYPAPVDLRLSAADAAVARQLVERGDPGRRLEACRDCHGQDLMGSASGTPGLLGLPRDYLNAQLGAWREGLRRSFEPDCMSRIARQLTASEVSALTAWLASQPAAPRRPTPAEPAAPTGAAPAASAPSPDCSRLPSGHAQVRSPQPAPPSRGEYLLRIGNCAGCHSSPGQPAFSGDKPIPTPFGAVYSTNLTPHPEHGLGRWSADDFWRAMREGVSRDGRLLYPAFPYAHYGGLTRADADAMFDWLRTLPPAPVAARPHRLVWPASTQWALRLWRAFFFKPFEFQPDARQNAQWNRGRYLVDTLGHCGACHTPRNRFGATDERHALAGARMPASGWYAPSLRPSPDDPQAIGDAKTLAELLTRGSSAGHRMSGPMAEIVASSLAHLSPTDAQAMAVYLTDRPVQAPVAAAAPRSRDRSADDAAGAALYKRHCTDCHGGRGEGSPDRYPPLAGQRVVQSGDATNLVQFVLYGGFGPSAPGNPVPYGMPPYLLTLDDGEAAALLTFVRRSWGNDAAVVRAQDIARIRGLQAH